VTELDVTRIAHSCHLLRFGDAVVLTDPWFTFTATYDPGEAVARTVDDLPDLAAVVVTHEHYDHCDLAALEGYHDLGVPVICPGTVVATARECGFTDVRELEAWDATAVGDLTVTAAPGKHGVHEVTYVLQAGERTVWFGGDTLRIPELEEIPDRFGPLDLALLPTNGLCVRVAGDRQVVMNASEAAQLAAVLRPAVALPHHFAFTSGRLGDRMITRSDNDPRHFADAVARHAPDTTVWMPLPGERVRIP
jgi:L-ascorbate metabolism protein UlaG (beta-lactamase superfamily)